MLQTRHGIWGRGGEGGTGKRVRFAPNKTGSLTNSGQHSPGAVHLSARGRGRLGLCGKPTVAALSGEEDSCCERHRASFAHPRGQEGEPLGSLLHLQCGRQPYNNTTPSPRSVARVAHRFPCQNAIAKTLRWGWTVLAVRRQHRLGKETLPPARPTLSGEKASSSAS